MNRRSLLKNLMGALPASYLLNNPVSDFILNEPALAKGPFKADWSSLEQYQTPDWYKNAKFGIWAHWGPQCQPEYGDWYARGMYQEDSDQYKYHLKTYGHPSRFGFKDVIHEWKAEQWDPHELVNLYKNAGAGYFVALANHHDNFDLYNSSYQSWTSVKQGPRKDIIAGWAKAAKTAGLRFGVSVHAAHAWSWMEVAQRHDLKGNLSNRSYDGKLRKADGKGQWWEHLDPQELYAQNHLLSENSIDNGMIHRQWDWGNGVTPPSDAYCNKFFKRTIELIDKYNPDLLYFDDTALPLWPVSDVGLKIAAHFYNKSIERNGSLQAVINGKILNEQQRKCMVWDIERGQSNEILPYYWQTDTCLGNWHYDKRVLERHEYKSAKTVIHTLVDVVSKNGNLLLSIPVKGNGAIDNDEREIIKGITEWMKINSEAIYDTRPFTVYGEGPAMLDTAALTAQGFNEGKGKPFTADDIRFTQKNKILYATIMGVPKDAILIKTLKNMAVTKISLLGSSDDVQYEYVTDGLLVRLPDKIPSVIASVLKIENRI